MELNKVIQERHSTRKFSSKKPDWRTILECIDAVRFAPMAGNDCTVKFIFIDDKEKIEKIAKACQQPFVGEAHYLVAVCSVKTRTISSYGERGEVFVRQQAGAAIQNFLLRLTEEGLATCWIGHFAEEQVKRILKIPAKAQVEAVFPIGYEFERKHFKREKIDLETIMYFDTYGNRRMKRIGKQEV